MANPIEFNAAIESHLAGWTPTLIVKDNEPSPTDKETEYIYVQELGGDGFTALTTGILGIRGNVERHPFLLRFNIYTAANAGLARSTLLVNEVIERWRNKDLGSGVNTLNTSYTRIGTEARRFRVLVDVSGFYDQTF